MDDTLLTVAQIIASFATAAALLVAVLQWRAAYSQLRTMQQQLEHTRVQAAEDRAAQAEATEDLRRGEQTRNAFELVTYLERPEHVDARRRVGLLTTVPYHRWTTDDAVTGELVSGLWEVTATMEALGRFPAGFVAGLYGSAITRHWRTLKPVVDQIRERTGDDNQRRHFELLAHGLAPAEAP